LSCLARPAHVPAVVVAGSTAPAPRV